MDTQMAIRLIENFVIAIKTTYGGNELLVKHHFENIKIEIATMVSASHVGLFIEMLHIEEEEIRKYFEENYSVTIKDSVQMSRGSKYLIVRI